MRTFRPATITDKREETADSVVLTLAVPREDHDDFRYRHGQHLPVRAEIDGKSVRRTYSICAGAGEQRLKLGVRVQPGGVLSNYLASLEPGDTLEIMPPYGHFNTALDPDAKKTYAAFVAGSGITPILSIVTTTLETEADSRFVVFYGNRKRATTMFVEELWALKNRFRDRLALHFVMSQEPGDIPLYEGRLDAGKLRDLHTAFLGRTRPDEVFL
ncbi:MAG: FAD-binding oxidoreductase, partial [Pseudomonadota bacterium]